MVIEYMSMSMNIINRLLYHEGTKHKANSLYLTQNSNISDTFDSDDDYKLYQFDDILLSVDIFEEPESVFVAIQLTG